MPFSARAGRESPLNKNPVRFGKQRIMSVFVAFLVGHKKSVKFK
jgi:hypothetical protein